jgi:hypothetical protein
MTAERQLKRLKGTRERDKISYNGDHNIVLGKYAIRISAVQKDIVTLACPIISLSPDDY